MPIPIACRFLLMREEFRRCQNRKGHLSLFESYRDVPEHLTGRFLCLQEPFQYLKGDDLCCYLSKLGGWFPIRMVDKVPNSDGYNDNVLHTTNAVVYVSRIRVDAVNVQKNIVKIGGVWVDPTPLTEIA